MQPARATDVAASMTTEQFVHLAFAVALTGQLRGLEDRYVSEYLWGAAKLADAWLGAHCPSQDCAVTADDPPSF